MAWNANDIPDLNGKIAVVTGANSGLGYQTALELARKGARVVMACRNAEKAETARKKIEQEVSDADLAILLIDLADFASIREFSENFKKLHDRLDLLINNAGLGGFPFGKTKDGWELHFGVNHLGHFLLTGLLLEILRETPGTRVVQVSSIMNRIGRHDFRDINYEKRNYNKWHAYGRSKLANALFTYELNKQLTQHDIEAVAVTAHPGYSATSFQGKGPAEEGSKMSEWMMKVSNALFAQADEMGALPTLYAATADDIRGGEYIGPSFFRVRGYPEKQKATAAAYNDELASRLWHVSEQCTGFSYTF